MIEATPRYQEIFRREAKSLPRAVRSLAALRVFEERLASSQSGWLVGEGLTYVDIALFEILDQSGHWLIHLLAQLGKTTEDI